METKSCDDDGLEAAGFTVSDGGTIIYPTDTVYALGCNPFKAEAVSDVYVMKRRDPSKQMPVLFATPEDAWALADLPESQRNRVEQFWPGALTVVAPLYDTLVSDFLMLPDYKIAARVPACPCTRMILESCGPLIGTSANLSGSPPVQSPDKLEDLGADLLIDGGTIEGDGAPSTVIEIGETVRIIRQGAISKEELRAVWTSL